VPLRSRQGSPQGRTQLCVFGGLHLTYPRTWWGDFNVSLHWPRAFCFYAFATIGAFLAPVVHYDRLALALLAVFFYLQIAAYAADLRQGNHIGQTHFSRQQLLAREALGLFTAVGIGIYLATTVSWVVLPLMVIGAVGILGYNYEVLGMHSRIVFGLVWGLYPVVSYNVLMTLAFPPLVVWIFGFSAVAFAELHITSYGLWSCRLPDKYCCVSEGRKECHGMAPSVRRTVSKELHRLAKRQSNLQVAFLGLVTLAIVVWRLLP